MTSSASVPCHLRKRCVLNESRQDALTSSDSQAELIHAERQPQHETSFIILSDLHLDNHKIMGALEKLLSAYESMDDSDKPSLFVLCGNFRSRPFLYDGEATREYQGVSHDFHSSLVT